jgi:hypothetical protein
LHAQLASAVAALPAIERKVLSLYYEGELTLAQIGSVIGLGESRVSQLRAGALGRLRAALKPLPPANRQEAAATPAPWRGRQRRNRNPESMRGARRAQGGRRSAAKVTAAGGRNRLKRRAA